MLISITQSIVLVLLLALAPTKPFVARGFQFSSRLPTTSTEKNHRHHPIRSTTDSTNNNASSKCVTSNAYVEKRRNVFYKLLSSSASVAAAVLTSSNSAPSSNAAVVPTGPKDGNLMDLPQDAARTYLQYRIPLQIFADFYIFDLQYMIFNTDDWGEIQQLFRVNSNRGQGQPSKIERDFTNIIRILSLSLPPDTYEDLLASQYKFERAMNQLNKVTTGIRRDLPVEIDATAMPVAMQAWEDGRIAINECFMKINEATGLGNELKTIPPLKDNSMQNINDQIKLYGRSNTKYFNLIKKTKLCQNRGGPALSQGWGMLMVSGYLQDSCGIPDLNEYFYQ